MPFMIPIWVFLFWVVLLLDTSCLVFGLDSVLMISD